MANGNRKTGVLLVNVGTPAAPTAAAVRPYLREFLGDPRVLDINPAGRWLLLNFIILPFRPKQSAEAYEKIWLPEGSPLVVYGERFARKLEAALGADFKVVLAMRYGAPSIAQAFDTLKAAGVRRVAVFPLYPQYASSTTGTSLEAVYRIAADDWNVLPLTAAGPFYEDDNFAAAFAANGAKTAAELRPDHTLFSFHGLPERHVHKSHTPGTTCESERCTEAVGEKNRDCYRAQCYATARAIAAKMNLASGAWTVSFQSRLGRDPWLKPYTDETVPELARRGVKRLAVFCPAFVTDCLETLEEIGLRARDDFLKAGGEDFALVPSLNDSEAWVNCAQALITTRTSSR